MVQEYLGRRDQGAHDPHFGTEPGDAVLVRQRIPSKLQDKEEIPCTFLWRIGENLLGARLAVQCSQVGRHLKRPYRGLP